MRSASSVLAAYLSIASSLLSAQEPYTCDQTSGVCKTNNNEVIEVPAGLVNGTNALFSLSSPASVPADVRVYVDGRQLHSERDFEVAGQTLTFRRESVPQSSSMLRVAYQTQFPRIQPKDSSQDSPPAEAVIRSALLAALDSEYKTYDQHGAQGGRQPHSNLRSLAMLGEQLRVIESRTALSTKGAISTQGVEGLGDYPHTTAYSTLLGMPSLYGLDPDVKASRSASDRDKRQQPRSLLMLEQRLDLVPTASHSKEE